MDPSIEFVAILCRLCLIVSSLQEKTKFQRQTMRISRTFYEDCAVETISQGQSIVPIQYSILHHYFVLELIHLLVKQRLLIEQLTEFI